MEEVVENRRNCSCGGGVWLALAFDLCEKNGLDSSYVGGLFYNCLAQGRSKHTNVIIIGESNCGKTFLLEPLSRVFENTMHTPASSVFGWLGVETAQVVFLNDFRWVNPVTQKQGVITWDAFLRLLEGKNCALPAPMNSHASHIILPASNDVPIFCTSIDQIKYYQFREDEPRTARHVKEDGMMEERWIKNPLHLKHVFTEDEKVEVDACAWCFCKFVLSSQS